MPLEEFKKTRRDCSWMGHTSFWSTLVMLYWSKT